FKKHRELYRRLIRKRPRWDYYSIVAALAALALSLAGGPGPIAAAAGALWLVLTARFCAARPERGAEAPVHVLEVVVTSMLIPPIAVFWRLVGALRYRVVFL